MRVQCGRGYMHVMERITKYNNMLDRLNRVAMTGWGLYFYIGGFFFSVLRECCRLGNPFVYWVVVAHFCPSV